MAYNFTNFTDYVGRESQVLTAQLFAGGDTLKFARLINEVKGSTTIPVIGGGATLQKGACKSPNGDTAVHDAKLSVEQFTVNETFCNDDLQTKFPNQVLAPGSYNNDMPKSWEEALIDSRVSAVNETLENLYWQGDVDGNNDLFDGFIRLIDEDGNAIDGNEGGATEITIENVIDLVEGMRTAASAKSKRDPNFGIYVGDDIYDLYVRALRKCKSCGNVDAADGVIQIGGTRTNVYRVYGLSETERMFAGVGSNFVVGTDVEDEQNLVRFYEDEVNDKTGLRIKGKSGVQVVNVDEIVEFTLA